MDTIFTFEARKRIQEGISQKYTKVAVSPVGHFKYPTGRDGLERLNYPRNIIEALPDEVSASYCGVGNPFSLGQINQGEAILDIGCGTGVDTFVAAMLTGPSGSVMGIDLTSEMLERAEENLRKTNLGNVSFAEASAEDLPFLDASFDVAISNGVFNLVPDKAKALKEVWRVMKPNGRLMMADQVLTTEPPTDAEVLLQSWAK